MIRQFTTIDVPDKRDYDFEEYAAGPGETRPRHEAIVFDQGGNPSCTRYALGHIFNGSNVLEYRKNGAEFTQKDPDEWRDKGGKIKSLQATLSEFRSWGLIEGYVVIKTDKINGIKKALGMGMFIFTGSDNGLRGIYKSPRNYQKRKDGKIVGHAWSIVGDEPENERFVVINSFGPDRGDSGYFYLPYKDIDSCFSLNVIVDHSDDDKFKMLRQKEKIKQFINIAKDIYNNGDVKIKQKLITWGISDFFSKEYGITV